MKSYLFVASFPFAAALVAAISSGPVQLVDSQSVFRGGHISPGGPCYVDGSQNCPGGVYACAHIDCDGNGLGYPSTCPIEGEDRIRKNQDSYPDVTNGGPGKTNFVEQEPIMCSTEFTCSGCKGETWTYAGYCDVTGGTDVNPRTPTTTTGANGDRCLDHASGL